MKHATFRTLISGLNIQGIRSLMTCEEKIILNTKTMQFLSFENHKILEIGRNMMILFHFLVNHQSFIQNP